MDQMHDQFLCFENATLIDDKKQWQGNLWVLNGLFCQEQRSKKEQHALQEQDALQEQHAWKEPLAARKIDLGGYMIAPGFIDLQVNGAFGFDFAKDPHAVAPVAKGLTRYGITSFLPTLVTSPEGVYRSLPPLPEKTHGGAEALGWHLEGPQLNPRYAGAHNADYMMLRYNTDFWNCILKQPVLMVTLAPEVEGSLDLIERLSQEGVVVSCGHTDATEKELKEARNRGLLSITHLFNAMRPFHARESGPIGYTLGKRDLFYTVIADGIHVSDSALSMAYQANKEGMILISDAISLLGSDKSEGVVGDLRVEKRGNSIFLEGKNTLAGSSKPLNEIVAHFIEATGAPVEEAIYCVTRRPAQLLGLTNKGSLAEGADADFVVLDKNLSVVASFVRGKPAYIAPELQGRIS